MPNAELCEYCTNGWLLLGTNGGGGAEDSEEVWARLVSNDRDKSSNSSVMQCSRPIIVSFVILSSLSRQHFPYRGLQLGLNKVTKQ